MILAFPYFCNENATLLTFNSPIGEIVSSQWVGKFTRTINLKLETCLLISPRSNRLKVYCCGSMFYGLQFKVLSFMFTLYGFKCQVRGLRFRVSGLESQIKSPTRFMIAISSWKRTQKLLRLGSS